MGVLRRRSTHVVTGAKARSGGPTKAAAVMGWAPTLRNVQMIVFFRQLWRRAIHKSSLMLTVPNQLSLICATCEKLYLRQRQ